MSIRLLSRTLIGVALFLVSLYFLQTKKTANSTPPQLKTAQERPSNTTSPIERSSSNPINQPLRASQKVALQKTTHTVVDVPASGLIFVLKKTIDPADEQHLQIALSAELKASSSGRTGKQLHFPPGVSASEAQQRLINAGIEISGELKSFRFQSAHDHQNCGTCLIPNYQALSQLPGVIQVPNFLGDPNSELIDIVIDSQQIDSAQIISVLETDHASQL